MRLRIIFVLSVLISLSIRAQVVYRTEPLSADIHTIQVNVNGDWKRSAILSMNSDDYIQISFDRTLENSFNQLRYKILHCNADWTPSSLSEMEYMEGFNDNRINDYAPSVNTTVEYTNFQLQLPNSDVSLKLSGNYVVIVYDEVNPSNILLSACFSILDNQVNIFASVSSNTLIDANKEHQQVSFTINHQGINVRDPFRDLKVYVRQNNRLDNEKSGVVPTFVQPFRLVYEQNRALIFEAGNEYRRFESISYRFNGLNIEHTEYHRPFYYTSIIADKIRDGKRYVLDLDQNGRFLIRNAEVRNNDTEADYFFVKFTLHADHPFIENIYLNGYFTNNTFSDTYLMHYDPNNQEYNAVVQLKQGAYNYQYLVKRGNDFSTSGVEGNYFETENEYQILAYFRPPGERYDSLIGYTNIQANRRR